MTAAQRAELPEEEDVTAADRLIVESPSDTGLIVMRALAPEPGLMPVAQTAARQGRLQAGAAAGGTLARYPFRSTAR